MVAKDIARRQQRQGDRLFVVRRGLLPGHPDQLLLPHHLSAGEIIHAGHQRDIDLAALHASDKRCRERAVQLQLDARKGFPEDSEDRREHEGGIEVRGTEYDMTFDVRRRELRQHFVVKSDDRSRVAQDCLAFRRQKQPAALVDEDRFSSELLKPLQLKGNRGLGTTKPPRGLGDAAGFDDRHQRAQHAYVQIDQVHGVARCAGRAIPCNFRAWK